MGSHGINSATFLSIYLFVLCYFDWKEEMGFGYCSVGEWVSSRKLSSSGDTMKCTTRLCSSGDTIKCITGFCSGGDTIKCITELCSGGDFTERITRLKELIRVLVRKERRLKVNMITCLS